MCICFSSLLKEAQETLSNVSVTSKTISQPLISDFQDFVLDMQKTIKSLRKQVCLWVHRDLIVVFLFVKLLYFLVVFF